MDYLKLNKAAWNQRTKVHVNSTFYDVESFKQGKSSLNALELEQLGNVEGKSLLHLQCHFGLDTLSLARLGADVTGVDLSAEAIRQANQLARELGLRATFVESDVYRFGRESEAKFDVVFTSYGVLSWLPDLTLWARVVAKSLKVGGRFHLFEFHPVNDLLSGYAYFPESEPVIESEGTYTENCDGTPTTTATWSHSMAEVLTALMGAGMRIESFAEHPFSPYDCFDGLKPVEGQGFQRLHKAQQVPLVYSVKARRMA